MPMMATPSASIATLSAEAHTRAPAVRTLYPANVAGMGPRVLATDPPSADPTMRPPEYTATAIDAMAAGSPKEMAESAKMGSIAPMPISARNVGR